MLFQLFRGRQQCALPSPFTSTNTVQSHPEILSEDDVVFSPWSLLNSGKDKDPCVFVEISARKRVLWKLKC